MCGLQVMQSPRGMSSACRSPSVRSWPRLRFLVTALLNFTAARFSAFCGFALNVIAAGEKACAEHESPRPQTSGLHLAGRSEGRTGRGSRNVGYYDQRVTWSVVSVHTKHYRRHLTLVVSRVDCQREYARVSADRKSDVQLRSDSEGRPRAWMPR